MVKSYNPLVCISEYCNTKGNRRQTQLFVLCFSLFFYYEILKGGYLAVYYGYGWMPVIYIPFAIVFGSTCAAGLLAHARLLLLSPGHVFPGQSLPGQVTVWDECNVCRARRPLGAHHCRVCDVCVLRRDHHCPWINNCVGLGNQWLFILFASYVGLASCLLCVFLLCHLLVQTCKTCPYPETRRSSAISFGVAAFCTLSAMGVTLGQVTALARRVVEVKREMEAQKLNSESSQNDGDLEKGHADVEHEKPEASTPDPMETLRMNIIAWNTVLAEIRGGHPQGVKALISMTPFWTRSTATFPVVSAV